MYLLGMTILPIPGVPGYSASDEGFVIGPCSNGMPLYSCVARGYRICHVRVNRKTLCRSVHSLVLAAFSGPRPQGLVANHINGNKLDNRPCNLEWVTPSENIRHAFRTGLNVSPNKGKFGKLHHGYGKPSKHRKPLNIDAIVSALRAGKSRRQAAAEAKTYVRNVARVLIGKHWQSDEFFQKWGDHPVPGVR